MSIKTDVGPFAIMPLWLLESGVSATALHLFAIMAAKWANQDGVLFPSRKTLMGSLGARSERTVDAALKDLERVGALTIAAQKDIAGDHAPNSYLLHFAAPPGAEICARGGAENVDHPWGRKLLTNQTHTELDPIELDTPPTASQLSPRLLPEEYPAWAEGFHRIEGLSAQTIADLVRVAGEIPGVADTALVLAFVDWFRLNRTRYKSIVGCWRNRLKSERDEKGPPTGDKAQDNPYAKYPPLQAGKVRATRDNW